MDDDTSQVICGVMHGDKRAWVPMADYDDLHRKMQAFRRCIGAIAEAFRVLELEADNGWQAHSGELPDAPEWTQPTEPAPLGD